MNNINDKYSATYFGRLGNCISQLGHTISGGAADVSISGKTGYKNLVKPPWYWKLNRKIVDFAFYPIDGNEHCFRAYMVDRNEKYRVGEGIAQDIICSVFIWIVCPFVVVLAYPIKWLIKGITKIISIFTE